METKKYNCLSEEQQFRFDLLQWFGNIKDAIEAAEFVTGCFRLTKEQAQILSIGGIEDIKAFKKWKKAKKAQLPKPEWKHGEAQMPSEDMPDGVYLVQADGQVVLYVDDLTADTKDVIGVGIKMGSFNLMVALHDAAKGKAVALTTKNNGTDENKDDPYYFKDYVQAVESMNGKAYTEHLRPILNPEIELSDGWWIPSLGEMYSIFINFGVINRALKFAGGDLIKQDCYWTSTEGSAPSAWYLNLDDGTSGWYTKASSAGRVRPVSAFIS